jgi:hypothetical protein
MARRHITGTVAAVTEANLPGRDHSLSLDQAVAVEQIATSGRSLDVLVGPAGTGKSTTMAGLRAAWEAEHGRVRCWGLAPSAAAAEVLAANSASTPRTWPSGSTSTARKPSAWQDQGTPHRTQIPSQVSSPEGRLRQRIIAAEDEVARWRLRADQLVIVDEASLAGTFALDELVTAAASGRGQGRLGRRPGSTQRGRSRRDVRRPGARPGATSPPS